MNVLLAIVRARLAAKKSRSSFAKEKVWNFIRIVISLKSSLLGGWAIELGLLPMLAAATIRLAPLSKHGARAICMRNDFLAEQRRPFFQLF